MGRGTAWHSFLFKALLATWWCGGAAFDLEVDSSYLAIYDTRSGGHWHDSSGCELKLWISSHNSGAKALARNKEITEFALTMSYPQWLGILLSATKGLPHRCGDTSDLGKGSHQPSETTRYGNLRDGCKPLQLLLPDQTFSVLPLCFEPTQGCQKCDRCSGMLGGLVGSPK